MLPNMVCQKEDVEATSSKKLLVAPGITTSQSRSPCALGVPGGTDPGTFLGGNCLGGSTCPDRRR